MGTRVSRDSWSIIVSVAGFLLLMSYLWILRAGDLPPYEVYWISIVLIVFPLLLLAGGFSSERSAMVGLIIFSFNVYLMYPLLTRAN